MEKEFVALNKRRLFCAFLFIQLLCSIALVNEMKTTRQLLIVNAFTDAIVFVLFVRETLRHPCRFSFSTASCKNRISGRLVEEKVFRVESGFWINF